jgi:class 3 adenylate cyclase
MSSKQSVRTFAEAHPGVAWLCKHVLLDLLSETDTFNHLVRKIVMNSGMFYAVNPLGCSLYVLSTVPAMRAGDPELLSAIVSVIGAWLLMSCWIVCYAIARSMRSVPDWLADLWCFGCSLACGVISVSSHYNTVIPQLVIGINAVLCGSPRLPLQLALCSVLSLLAGYNAAATKYPDVFPPVMIGPGSLDGAVVFMLLNFSNYVVAIIPVGTIVVQSTEFHRLFAFQGDMYEQQSRDTTFAPREGRIAILFTDIQDSTKLWGNVPQSMGAALDTHHSIIRECIKDYEAFEVKTAGDSFMIAAGDEGRAMQLATDIQLRLLRAGFPRAIDDVYAASTDDALRTVDDDPDFVCKAQPSACWHGLRVRIGIHSGTPGVVFDEVTKGYDYYGPEVNIAARVEAVGQGGQICCTRAFVDAQLAGPRAYTTTAIGKRSLKGVPDVTEIFQVTPAALVNRVFATVESVRPMARADSASSLVSAAADAQEGDYAPFVSAMFSALRKADERDMALGIILRGWRLQRSDTAQKTYEAIAHRVGATAGVRRQPSRHGSDHEAESTASDDAKLPATRRKSDASPYVTT